MLNTQPLDNLPALHEANFHPGLSVDCVIFGFHDNQLKVLLLKSGIQDSWLLAGGYVPHEMDMDAAAEGMLRYRTGLTDIFLRQFYTFGQVSRSAQLQELLVSGEGVNAEARALLAQQSWLAKRHISVGYYALVDFTDLRPRADDLSESVAWWDMGNLPPLMMDHRSIIEKALEALRLRLRHEPIGYKLLPEKFTMPELQKLYEAILGRPLDRRNFQRKMLSYGTLQPLEEYRTGGAHKSPRLYAFDLPAYQLALKEGLKGDW